MTNLNLVKITLVIIFGIFLLNNVVMAQNQPILPDSYKKQSGDYDTNDMIETALHLANVILGISGSLALLFIMYGGVLMVFAGANQKHAETGKSAIKGSALGLIIIFIAFTAVNFVFTSAKIPKWNIIERGPSKPITNIPQPSVSAWPTATRDASYIKGTWKFDPGISNQVSEASPDVVNLLNCMKFSGIPDGVGRISSISDSKGIEYCKNLGYGCAHSANSCHYDRGGTGLSKAIDFGDEQNAEELQQYATECGKTLGYNVKILNEGNHVHVSVNCGNAE